MGNALNNMATCPARMVTATVSLVVGAATRFSRLNPFDKTGHVLSSLYIVSSEGDSVARVARITKFSVRLAALIPALLSHPMTDRIFETRKYSSSQCKFVFPTGVLPCNRKNRTVFVVNLG